MRAGEKASYQGYQVCLFPLDYLYCTQVSGPDSFSHCCGHPCDYVGTTTTYPIYAPCDCILGYTYPDGNTRVYYTTKKVWTPQGLSYVSFSFTHDNNPPSATTFKQGALIGHTGTAGFVTGDHTHIDQSNISNAPLVSYGITCSGGNECYALQDSQYPYNIFYLSGSETIVQTQGMNFDTWSGSPIYHDGGFKWWMAKKVIERRKNGL